MATYSDPCPQCRNLTLTLRPGATRKTCTMCSYISTEELTKLELEQLSAKKTDTDFKPQKSVSNKNPYLIIGIISVILVIFIGSKLYSTNRPSASDNSESNKENTPVVGNTSEDDSTSAIMASSEAIMALSKQLKFREAFEKIQTCLSLSKYKEKLALCHTAAANFYLAQEDVHLKKMFGRNADLPVPIHSPMECFEKKIYHLNERINAMPNDPLGYTMLGNSYCLYNKKDLAQEAYDNACRLGAQEYCDKVCRH